MSGGPRRAATTCAHCGGTEKCPRLILDKPSAGAACCDSGASPLRCPDCRELRILAFYDAAGRPACATCTGDVPVYACVDCGREDSPFGRRCGPCVLSERVSALLRTPTGGIHPALQPVFDALIAGPRPQSALYWLTRSVGPDILRAMARGDIEISHAAFDELASNKAVTYFRDLLVALVVLPAYHAKLERVSPWLDGLLATLPADQAELIGRFARWHVLRRLEHQGQAGNLTHGAVSAGRTTIVSAIRFLAWLAERQRTSLPSPKAISTSTPPSSPRSATHSLPSCAGSSGPDSPAWSCPPASPANPSRALRRPALGPRRHAPPRRQHPALHPGRRSLLTAVRPAVGAGVPDARRADRPNLDGRVTVTFDTFAIELPDPLDGLVLDQLSRRGQSSYASSAEHWLFPGGIPGNHLATGSIRSQLVAVASNRPRPARPRCSV